MPLCVSTETVSTPAAVSVSLIVGGLAGRVVAVGVSIENGRLAALPPLSYPPRYGYVSDAAPRTAIESGVCPGPPVCPVPPTL